MKYYDTAFRSLLTEILSSYRKMLEQSIIATNEQNYQILVSDKIKKIDEVLKIIRPSIFDALTVQKIEKLQTEKFFQEKEVEYKKQAEQLKTDYEMKLELAKRELKEQLRTQIEEKLRKERAEKKKRKKAIKQQTAIDLLKNMQFSSNVLNDETADNSKTVTSETITVDEFTDDLPEFDMDNIE